jgi:hypothetical protein
VENDAMHSSITIRQLRLDEREVTLAEAMDAADPRARLLVPFEATWRGHAVLVTAVLERTAVCHPVGAAGDPDERLLVRRAELVVEAGRLRWAGSCDEFPPCGRRSGAGPRRCPNCQRTASETAFRAYRATYCIDCSRARQRAYYHERVKRAA